MMTCQQVCQHALMPPQRLTRRQAFWRLFHLMICGRCRLALRQFKLMIATSARRHDPEPSVEQIQRWLAGVDADKPEKP